MSLGSTRIPVAHGHLEAILKLPAEEPRAAAVVCHPHPLHGGTMHTKAVYRAAQGLNDAGFAALRFNFRGVGTSTGSHDDGVGERDDLRAAIDWLTGEYPTLPLVVGGFSFGSLVALHVGCEHQRVAGMFGLGLPVDLEDRYDFGFLADAAKPILVVQGENDEFGAGPAVARALAPLGEHITLTRVPDTDHFFAGRLDDLRAAVRGYYESGPGALLLSHR